jgi:hypothetical protein
MEPATSTIHSSPEWYLHKFDPTAERALLLHLDEATYRAASFLDERVEPEASEGYWFALQQLLGLASITSRHGPCFVFHIGHCGSTLLSRALAMDPQLLPLREPLTLRTLAVRLRENTQAPLDQHGAWQLLNTLTLGALSRTFVPGQTPLVKATSTCNNLIRPLLTGQPQRRAVLMYQPLETSLANLLGKPEPSADLRGFLPQRLRDWQRLGAETIEQPAQLSEAMMTAISWISSMADIASAAAELGQQVRLLNFDDLLDEPETTLGEVAPFLRPQADCNRIIEAWPEISSRYSKLPGTPYSAEHRQQRLQRARKVFDGEIRQALDWARQQIDITPAFSNLAPFLD